MSKSVLNTIGGGKAVNVNGAPWQDRPDMHVGINSLTANILCKRHNSTMSSLDESAGEFFKKLIEIFDNLNEKSDTSTQGSCVSMNGDKIERWMLKVACGFYFSGNASNNKERLFSDHSINSARITKALCDDEWGSRCGLYMQENVPEFSPKNEVSVSVLTILETKTVIGAELLLCGLRFRLYFDPEGWGEELPERAGWGFRPSDLHFRNALRTHSIKLTWEKDAPPKPIYITLSTKNQPARWIATTAVHASPVF